MMFWIPSALIAFLALSSSVDATFETPLNRWYKYACTAENMKLSNTYYCDSKGRIICLPGYTDESKLCTVPICEINGRNCVNGNCSKPFTCDCEVGWTGQFCEKCVCLPGCVNGHCNRSLECVCEPGWSGMLCDRPKCEGCQNGECVMPGMCVCHSGWSGPNCSVCEPRSDCLFGRCINEPFECSCYDGYTGVACENPICSEGCHPENGFCMMPDTCWCREGWSGPNCTECVPYWNCKYGSCNKPWECNCEAGWSGIDCNDNGTTNGNWGQWGSYGSCSATCGSGVQKRFRRCNNPRKTGNGTYCSLDGSSGVEIRPCSLPPCPPPANVNGNWGSWSNYSSCTTTCGAGTRIRTRLCNNPAPSGNGASCSGPAVESISCVGNPPCNSLPSQWNNWSSFSACSTTCGNGNRTRTRTCSVPNGVGCTGPSIDTQPCLGNLPCPINGNYTEWTSFGPCTAKCQGDIGVRVRRRFCTNPAPQYGGLSCTGLGADREEIPCNGSIPLQSTNSTQDCYNINS